MLILNNLQDSVRSLRSTATAVFGCRCSARSASLARGMWLLALFTTSMGQSCVPPTSINDPEEEVLGYHPAADTGTNSSLAADQVDQQPVTASQDNVASEPDPNSTTVEPASALPVAIPGPDQSVIAGAQVVLDGSASSGSAGGGLQFSWRQISGPQVVLITPSQAVAQFVAPQVETDTILLFELMVSDGISSNIAQVHITVIPARVDLDQLAIIAGPDPDGNGLSITFDAVMLNGATLPNGLYSWDFGDETMATGRHVTHIYRSAAIYMATLCVTVTGELTSITGCSHKEVQTTASKGSAGNSTPVVDALSVTTYVNTPIQIMLTGNDPKQTQLDFSITTPPTHGSLVNLSRVGVHTASITYLPATGYTGTDSFMYAAENEDNLSPPAVVSVIIRPPGNLSVEPPEGLTATRIQGDATSSDSIVYTLTNTGSESISWNGSNTQNWVGLSKTSGVLTSGATDTVTVTISSEASALAVGNYSDTVTFTNTSNGSGDTIRHISLTVNPPVGLLSVSPSSDLAASGAQGGPFSPSSTMYTLTNNGGQSIDWTAGASQAWVDLSKASGTLPAGSTDTITVAINNAANSLAVGDYSDLVTFATGPGNESTTTIGVTLSIVQPTNIVTPIARWDVVPYQRINAGETLNVGVVAFSKAGIQKVQFTITGQGYSGSSPIDVSAMSLNPQNGVWEYWTPIAASSFASDGQITVEAKVIGNDLGVRDKTTAGSGSGLDTLCLTVNPLGTLPAPEAWVDATTGNDATAAIGDPTHPYLNLAKALAGVSAWMNAHGYGTKVDGGTVHMNVGTHLVSQQGVSSGIATANEWVTITTSTGGTDANTILQKSGDGLLLTTKHLRIKGLKLNHSGILCSGGAAGLAGHWWVDSCTVIGDGQWLAWQPVGYNVGSIYYTDSSISRILYPTRSGVMCRGLTIEHIGGDAFQNVPMIVNCSVDDINPGTTGEHADAWQMFGGTLDSNCIVYGYRATNLHYQAIYIEGNDGAVKNPPVAQGIALVNVYMALANPVVVPGGQIQWHRSTNHLLLWNCTFMDDGLVNNNFAIGYDSGTHQGFSNVSVRGCMFRGYEEWTPNMNIDYSDWKDNHYQRITNGIYLKHPGANWTTGNPGLDSFGRPQAGSPLLNRVTPLLVPADASGRSRGNSGAVGAYEGG